MPFNHDNMIGVRLAEDLVNLDVDGAWTRDAVSATLTRSLVRIVDLDDELTELHDWTRRLRGVFAATDTDARCELINELLAVGVRQVHLATHDGFPPHLHFAQDGHRLTERVQAATIGGLAIFAVEARVGRMGICSRPGCEHAYVDTSRNGRRAYCSAICGNAHAVQRYRERKAADRRGADHGSRHPERV
ncbi:CGNR zinc finger domain-containing protein [Arthrobacter sp. MMS18-M83]|uniref:CGNR zinc finger domain-containing protein n=1 Tax=Arthrobacter sp. MMS18-M83 TaxID=2996261 RepID=UPI00227A6BED|nr:CGNR zinc finger domain-containing protein [Arthrobacter sp. MMS18-M83]WAH96990.1 CGNR zinc finger domain-containing protein [Arthrobacter sp. MMS18-M83]